MDAACCLTVIMVVNLLGRLAVFVVRRVVSEALQLCTDAEEPIFHTRMAVGISRLYVVRVSGCSGWLWKSCAHHRVSKK